MRDVEFWPALYALLGYTASEVAMGVRFDDALDRLRKQRADADAWTAARDKLFALAYPPEPRTTHVYVADIRRACGWEGA